MYNPNPNLNSRQIVRGRVKTFQELSHESRTKSNTEELETIPNNNFLIPNPTVSTEYVSAPDFEEDEQEDIIQIRMIPLEAAFKDDEDETITFTIPSEKESDGEEEHSSTENKNKSREGIISAEEILKEAEGFTA